MIDKEKAMKRGIAIREFEQSLRESKQEKIEQIKKILPNLINSDGQLNIDVLRNHLGIENMSSESQGYGLNFAGKGLARIKTSVPTNFELHTELGQSKNFEDTENIIIRGDNLDALKILRQNYDGKIKMIYIDPPYNTQSDEFLYKDNFKIKEAELIEKYSIDEEQIRFFQNVFGTRSHSGWLYFMYPRLCLARDLLREDGVIFISVDDHEQSNLKIICDEIFGIENFVNNLIWEKKVRPSNKNLRGYSKTTEHILFYTKTLHNCQIKDEPQEVEYIDKVYRNPDNDPKGRWRTKPLYSESNYNKRNALVINGKAITQKWFVNQQKLDLLAREDRLYKSQNDVWSEKIYLSEISGKNPQQLLKATKAKTTEHATKHLKQIFDGNNFFPNPKPHELIKLLLDSLDCQEGIILDFFAGSGTTAEAVMKLNQEDGGNRKFILVQWDEEIDAEKNPEAYDFCKENHLSPVISSICIERVNRAGAQIMKEMQDADASNHMVDVGYKVFSLITRPNLQESERQIDLRNQRACTQDILYNMMSTSGEYPLSIPITEIEKDLLYKVDTSFFVLGECKTNLRQLKNHRLYIDGYANIDIAAWFNLLELCPLDNEKDERVKVLY